MANPTGFLDLRERETAPRRPVPVRIMDWAEVQKRGRPDAVRRQAGRCMDCGVAFCHQGCPLGNLIPEWNDLVRRGRIPEALERLHATNNFPEFTGRVCPAPCESACVLGISEPAVTIKQTEAWIIDEGFERGLVVPRPPERLSGKTVAVVGSGPAGLAAAQQLTRAGHTVVVYERDEAIGGLLRFGIPDFKLDKELIDRRIEQMRAEGTRFRAGVEIGRDMRWRELRRRFDAVLVATGAPLARGIDVPGADADGIVPAMSYLGDANRVLSGTLDFPRESAAGKHVIVIGGGDTGADCVGTAHRQGAASVTSLAIGRQPGTERSPAEPWPTHPTLFEVSSSHEEGGQRRYEASTVGFERDESGRVCALIVAETSFGPDGRAPRPGTERRLPADLVLLALGFTGAAPCRDDADSWALPMTAAGALARNAEYASAVPGVFVAGDAGRGQSLIVWAIAEGRAAAAAIDAQLTGETRLPSPVRAGERSFSSPR